MTGPYIVDPWNRVHVLSGWWRRALGLFLDGLILGVPFAIVELAIGVTHLDVTANGQTYSTDAGGWLVFVIVLNALVQVAYGALLIGWRGQTVGMMAARIRAVDLHTAGPLGRTRALRRALVAFALTGLATLVSTLIKTGSPTSGTLVVAGLLSGLGAIAALTTYLWPLGSSRNQTLQDLAVGSVVVRTG